MNQVQLVGKVSEEYKALLLAVFEKSGYSVSFKSLDDLSETETISLSKETSRELEKRRVKFYNWDLLLTTLGANEPDGELEDKIIERIKILQSIKNLKIPKSDLEFHGSIRVTDLASSSRFYTWLFGVEPKEWTHRYVTFH